MKNEQKNHLLNSSDFIPHIPGFQLVTRCGKGGTGEVWEAVDERGYLRAVRLVSREGEERDRCSKKEFRHITYFYDHTGKHENLAEIFFRGRTKKYLYYITPLADNAAGTKKEYIPDTLAERLKRKKVFSSEEILDIMLPMVSAVEYLHLCEIAHLDIKPENIIFHDGVLKITDPGLAGDCNKIYPPANGTRGYMPLIACSGRERDVYAMGKILYSLYSGNPAIDFPEIGENIKIDENIRLFNEIALKCCSCPFSAGCKDAGEMKKELLNIQRKAQISYKIMEERGNAVCQARHDVPSAQ